MRSRSLVDSGFKKTSYNGGGKTKPNQTPRLPAPLCCTPGAGGLAWSDPEKLSRGAGVGKARLFGLFPHPGLESYRGGDAAEAGVGEKAFLLHIPPRPPGDRACRAAAGPQPLPWGRGPGGSRGRHFSPGHGLRRHESLTRRLAGLRPGADGVAEHREAQVAQALTNRVRQLHAWPGGSLTPRASPWARRRRDAVSLATGLCQPLGTRDLGSSRI